MIHIDTHVVIWLAERRMAALSATHRRINELIDDYGVEAFRAAADGILDYVERVLRRRLSR